MNLVYSQLEDANKAYSAAQTERLNKEALCSQAQQSGNAIPAMLESQLIRKLRENWVTAASQYEEARVTFKDDYRSQQNLKAKMLDIEKDKNRGGPYPGIDQERAILGRPKKKMR